MDSRSHHGSGPVRIGSLVDLVLAKYGYLQGGPMATTKTELRDKVVRMLRTKERAKRLYKEAEKLFDEVRTEMAVGEPLPLGNGTSFVIRDQFTDSLTGEESGTFWKTHAIHRYDFDIVHG